MSRPKKAVSNCAGYQSQSQEARVAIIKTFLVTARNSHARFKHTTALAKMVAAHISQVEGESCVFGTLLRNPTYKQLLLSYQAGDTALTVKDLSAKSLRSGGAEAEALMTQLRLELANVKRENERLKAYVSELSSDVVPASNSSIALEWGKATAEQDFVFTCQVLLRVLENAGELLVVDYEQDRLLDSGPMVNNVIAEGALFAPYIAWLRANRTR